MSNLKLAGDVKRVVLKQIKLGTKKDLIIRRVISEFPDHDMKILEQVTLSTIRELGLYETVQKIIRSRVVANISKKGRATLYDPKEHTRTNFDPAYLRDMLDKNFDTSELMTYCNFEYAPETPAVLYPGEDGFQVYNEYEPPTWLERWFYSGGKTQVEPCDQIPEVMEKFLRHLTREDEESYEYLLDWLAYGIHSKNFCFLVTIGKQGVGKGKLGEIMEQIFGSTNYYVGGDKMFKGTFNSQIANKKLVYCDEILLKQRDALNRLKEVANFTIEKEAKGIDAENIKNYANFYISSNDIDGLPITDDDRRFSLIELTSKKLPTVMTPTEISSLTEDPEVIDKFARHLYYREVDQEKMLYPLKNKKRLDTIELTMSEWEKVFLYKLAGRYVGKFMEMAEIIADIKEAGCSISLSHSAFKRLADKKPGIFEARRARTAEKDEHGNRPYGVYVYKEGEAPDEE